MQDKIVGPLTMVQFVYAVIGFGFCYIIGASVPAPVSYILIAPIATFVLCLDFVKINERPFVSFFIAALTFVGNPKRRIWHQGDDSDLEIEIYHLAKDTGPKVASKGISHEDIQSIAKRDDRGDELIRK